MTELQAAILNEVRQIGRRCFRGRMLELFEGYS